MSLCWNTVRVAACFCLLGLFICSILHGRRGQSRSKHNQIKACIALKRERNSISVMFLPLGWNIGVWRGMILNWCGRVEPCLMFLWPSSFSIKVFKLCCAKSLEKEQSPWSMWRKPRVTRCRLHRSALEHYWNVWKMWLFRQDFILHREWDSKKTAACWKQEETAVEFNELFNIDYKM